MGLDGADESTTMDIPRTGPPLVSVIIPTYRRPDVIRDAISSVLAQTYAHLEVIVVSDGPDPQTAAAVSGMDDRVIYHELAVNSGPAEARNAGVAISRGQWIGTESSHSISRSSEE